MQKSRFEQALTASALAGGVAFVLSAAVLFGSPFALIAFLRPLPLFIVGFKYGAIATFLASMIAVLLVHSFFSYPQGIIMFFTIAVPAFAIIQVTSRALAIHRIEPRFEPLGLIVLFTTIIGVFITLATLFWAFGADFYSYSATLKGHFKTALEALKMSDIPSEFMNIVIESAPYMVPVTGVMLWVSFMLLNLFLSYKIAPKFAMTMPQVRFTQFRLPFFAVLLMGVGFGMTYAGDYTRLIGFILVASLIIGFVLQGLAIIHSKSQGKSWQKGFLIAFYLTSFIIGWPLLIAFLIGLADPAFTFRKTTGE